METVLTQYVSDLEDTIIETYSKYGVDVSYNAVKKWLNDWSENKVSLYEMFGNSLSYTFDISYQKNTITNADKKIKFNNTLKSIIGADSIRDVAPYVTKDYKYIVKNKQKVKLTKYLKSLVAENDRLYVEHNMDTFYKEINTTPIREKVVISIDPKEFILASENTSGYWRSCFSIEGEYHASTNSFIRAENIAILYILDREGNKKHRQWVVLGKDYFSKGKSYPEENVNRNNAVTKELRKFYPRGNFFSYHKNYDVIKVTHGVYLDSYNTWYYKDNKPTMIFLYEGEDCEGNDTNGSFTGVVCEDCGDSFNPDSEGAWSGYHEYYICDRCLDNYSWCEDVDSYVHYDYCVYLEDKGYYVTEGYIDKVYLEDVDYYVSSGGGYYYIDDLDIYVESAYDYYYIEDLYIYVEDIEPYYYHESDGCYYSYPEEEEEEEEEEGE